MRKQKDKVKFLRRTISDSSNYASKRLPTFTRNKSGTLNQDIMSHQILSSHSKTNRVTGIQRKILRERLKCKLD